MFPNQEPLAFKPITGGGLSATINVPGILSQPILGHCFPGRLVWVLTELPAAGMSSSWNHSYYPSHQRPWHETVQRRLWTLVEHCGDVYSDLMHMICLLSWYWIWNLLWNCLAYDQWSVLPSHCHLAALWSLIHATCHNEIQSEVTYSRGHHDEWWYI